MRLVYGLHKQIMLWLVFAVAASCSENALQLLGPSAVVPQQTSSPQLIAMVHVHSNTLLQGTDYVDTFGLAPLTLEEELVLRSQAELLRRESSVVAKQFSIPLLEHVRTAPLLFGNISSSIVDTISALPAVNSLIQRALSEVEIYVKYGINLIEVANCASELANVANIANTCACVRGTCALSSLSVACAAR